MLSLIPILSGALLTLATAYALGNLCLRALPAPRTIVLAVGAAALSVAVFLALLAGLANWVVFLAVAIAAIAVSLRCRAPLRGDAPCAPLDRASARILAVVLGLYSILYFFHALAPEIQPDAVSYHLGLVSEYHRLGAFPDRVGFYEVLPQGLEMLFLFAFSFGRHSAAKLVHFGFLLATLPLLVSIGRRLHLPDLAAWLAAVLYFCAPVVGVSGTSSYNDAALVFFGLAAFYLLLLWRQERDDRHLLPLGIVAGFCYAVKFPGLLVLPLAWVAVLLWGSRKPRQSWLLLAGGLAMCAPWMLRDTVMVGNPVAPLFNRWFPNPYFRAVTEQDLARNLASFGGISLAAAPWQLALDGGLQGIFGPLFLALPLGLLALRRRAGRLCWLAAALLALPWFANHGARFLMPAFPFAALAFAMLLPRPAAWACLVIEAVACWPGVLDFYTPKFVWRLHEVPWRAALRLEPESEYLWDATAEYKIARMIEKETRPGEKVFTLLSSPLAYVDREILGYWHSARADQLFDTLRLAALYGDTPLFDVTGTFPRQPLRGVRFRLTGAHPGEWDVDEVRLFLGDDRVYSSPQWFLRARPNPWDTRAAFDDNLATRWRSWEPMRPGMYMEADFDRPQLLTSAVMISHSPVYHVPFELDGQGLDGHWHLLAHDLATEPRPREPLRYAAAQAVRRAGYRYIMAPDGFEGNGSLGHDMVVHMAEWGLDAPGKAGDIYLFRVK